MSKIQPSLSYDYDVESQRRLDPSPALLYTAEPAVVSNFFVAQECENLRRDLQSDAEIYSASNLGKVLVQSWVSSAEEDNEGLSNIAAPSYNHMNLPPLVVSEDADNPKPIVPAFLKKYKGFLTFLSDLGSIIGSAFFSVGSIMGYGYVYGFAPASCGLVTCSLFQSLMALTGAIFFFITPIATFILSDAVSFTDKAMSWNSSMYILGGFLYVLGALAYVPFSFTTTDASTWIITITVGATVYVIASIVYVVAILWDMFRALKMKKKSQISFITFVIESWVSFAYLLGSLLLLLGSIFSYPDIYTPHIYAMFLGGSLSFTIGSVSGFTAQLWRYARDLVRRNELLRQKIKLMESIKLSAAPSNLIKRSHSSPHLMQRVAVAKKQLSFTSSNLKTLNTLYNGYNGRPSHTRTSSVASSATATTTSSTSSCSTGALNVVRQMSLDKLSFNFNFNLKSGRSTKHDGTTSKPRPRAISLTKLNPTRIYVTPGTHVNDSDELKSDDHVESKTSGDQEKEGASDSESQVPFTVAHQPDEAAQSEEDDED
mmetsp:Transcript_23227/g.39341  ORF Transcript_23227/g.39341 Transcript_23227/m.39341 type:complete len:543 (+) Transcript_23227:123-1751(+)